MMTKSRIKDNLHDRNRVTVSTVFCGAEQFFSYLCQLTNEASAEGKLACTMPCKEEEGYGQLTNGPSSKIQ